MPIAKHVSSLVQHLNSPTYWPNPENFTWSFKRSHGYDLLACMCGLSKYDFQKIGFVSSSLMPSVPTYQPYSEDFHSEVLNDIKVQIKEKIGITEDHKNILNCLVQRVVDGFQQEGSIIRHPDQLTAMVRELYDSDECIINHLDSLIELINDLEAVENKKKRKTLQPALHWLLHWCYATLFKQKSALQNEIVYQNRWKIKSKMLLDLYQPYFDRAQFALQKYYKICLDAKFDHALEFDNQLNSFWGYGGYQKTHDFAVIESKKNFYPPKNINPFYDVAYGVHLKWDKNNFFYEIIYSDLDSISFSKEVKVMLDPIRKIFRHGAISYNLDSDGTDLIKPGAQAVFSHMYGYYIKYQNFKNYPVVPVMRVVEE